MRIKLLPILSGLLITSFTMSSCLKSEAPNYEIIPDASIYAFQIDTVIGGVTKPFSIDQLKGKIFNQDSLPVGSDTIINKILITKISTKGASVSHNDAYISLKDSFDLTDPFVLQTKSIIDPSYTKTYTVDVRVHKEDPDSIVWRPLQALLGTNGDSKKHIATINNKVLSYSSTGETYSLSSHSSTSWEELTLEGITFSEQDTLVNLVSGDEVLYMQVGDKIYSSTNGTTWDSLSNELSVDKLLALAPANSKLYVISNNKYGTVDLENGATIQLAENDIDENFPSEYITSTTHSSNNKLTILLGVTHSDTDKRDLWITENGLHWFKSGDNSSSRAKLPTIKNPILFPYNNMLYALGQVKVTIVEKNEDGETEETSTKNVTKIYHSVDGINWEYANLKEQIPTNLDDKIVESLTIDKFNNIWFTIKNENEVWRGRLNSFKAE